MIDVTIIIINYNTFNLTCNCIKSVIEHSSGFTYEIILVDNASQECKADDFLNIFPAIKLVKCSENIGYAAGNNVGIKQASGKNILLLNSDTILKSNMIKSINDYLESIPGVGVVTPSIIYPNGIHQSVAQRFPSIKYSLFELFRLHKLISKEKAGKLLLGSFFNYDKTVEADWVWGTSFLIRKEIVQKMLGGKLDEEYFMYCEDMQWCMDIRKVGYEIHFYKDAEVIHLMGGSSGEKNELMLKNNELFLKRNYSFIHYKIIKLLTYLLNPK